MPDRYAHIPGYNPDDTAPKGPDRYTLKRTLEGAIAAYGGKCEQPCDCPYCDGSVEESLHRVNEALDRSDPFKPIPGMADRPLEQDHRCPSTDPLDQLRCIVNDIKPTLEQITHAEHLGLHPTLTDVIELLTLGIADNQLVGALIAIHNLRSRKITAADKAAYVVAMVVAVVQPNALHSGPQDEGGENE